MPRHVIGTIRDRCSSRATLGLLLVAAFLWLVVLPVQLVVLGVLRATGTGAD